MFPMAEDFFFGVQYQFLGSNDAISKENSYLRAKLEEQRAYAEQRFAQYQQQECLQREADKETLSRFVLEAQAQYQLLNDQLAHMMKECQDEIANKDVA